jgi:SMI1 / KNR4 family (SUKH-1)
MVEWIKRDEEIALEDFAQVEAKIGIRFPQDYKNWVKRYSRPKSGHAHILINDEPYHFDDFFDLEEIVDEVEELYVGEEEYKELGLIVPFGFDSALERYCFYYSQGNENPIIIWFSSDDTLSEIFDGKELDLDRVKIVRTTFTDFINDLYTRTDY